MLPKRIALPLASGARITLADGSTRRAIWRKSYSVETLRSQSTKMPIGSINRDSAPKRETFRPPWVKDKDSDSPPSWTQRKLKPVESTTKTMTVGAEESTSVGKPLKHIGTTATASIAKGPLHPRSSISNKKVTVKGIPFLDLCIDFLIPFG
ncbi:hypothetical protein EVAR_11291_1 [Eumeta japonica]|uniref:Uncharacterized protein n=1 Tax=Eumeta variegata TaxID=151549 RepID=A0A4C1UKV5_EUMVA|nr:hypothetical protein EVAR_11291_1 [Eumeta japonica]